MERAVPTPASTPGSASGAARCWSAPSDAGAEDASAAGTPAVLVTVAIWSSPRLLVNTWRSAWMNTACGCGSGPINPNHRADGPRVGLGAVASQITVYLDAEDNVVFAIAASS